MTQELEESHQNKIVTHFTHFNHFQYNVGYPEPSILAIIAKYPKLAILG